jgi:hypothetical protein
LRRFPKSWLAHCVSLTVNAIRAPRQSADESEANAAVLAREVGLDMVAYWQPTAASCFGRVSKERIVQAVRDPDTKLAMKSLPKCVPQASPRTGDRVYRRHHRGPAPYRDQHCDSNEADLC